MYYNVISMNDSSDIENSNVILSLTPILSEDEYRIVLTWGSTPNDLDSHLFYYLDGVEKFHVSYKNKTAYLNGEQVAVLDIDAVDSFGPETITITVDADLVKNGELKYCVHNYSGGYDQLSASNASIKIFKGNELLKEYSVIQNKKALVWHAFNINKNGIQTVYVFDDKVY